MRLGTTALRGLLVVEGAPNRDDRGSFMRVFCSAAFAAAGAPAVMVQASVATNPVAGTLRGLHCQLAPSREGKLVQCLRGALFDVAVDLRPDSPTFCQHYALELSGENARGLYIPPGFAHGYLTLTANSDVLYHMSDTYQPELGTGFRWNDPAFGIAWPRATPALISPRDASLPDFSPAAAAGFHGY